MKLVLTTDGSHTIYSEQFDEIYHSRHGAVSESAHVFIDAGLKSIEQKEINIFEVGLGTGLNAFLSWIYAEENDLNIHYTSIELYPVAENLLIEINYPELFPAHRTKMNEIHKAPWDSAFRLSDHFTLSKLNISVSDFAIPPSSQNIIYFDAFSPEKQPELWTIDVFKRMYDLLQPGGILVTYCSKSFVRKNMTEAGLTVGKLPGPHGKRDMVRASKNS